MDGLATPQTPFEEYDLLVVGARAAGLRVRRLLSRASTPSNDHLIVLLNALARAVSCGKLATVANIVEEYPCVRRFIELDGHIPKISDTCWFWVGLRAKAAALRRRETSWTVKEVANPSLRRERG